MDEIIDVPADITTTARVVVGGSFEGRMHFADDTDWVAVNLQAGVEYIIDLEGSSTGAGSIFDPEILGIIGPDGETQVAVGDDDDGEGLNSRVIFSPETSGTYYINVAEVFGDIGTYKLSVNLSFSGDTVVNTTNTTASLVVNSDYLGTYDYSNDADWIRVSLTAGNRYLFVVSGASEFVDNNELEARSPNIRGLYNSSGELIAGTERNSEAYRSAELVYNATESGSFYLGSGFIKSTI